MTRGFILFSFLLAVFFTACEEITTINPVPVIKYKDFTLEQGRDTLGNIVFVGKLLFEFNDDDGADLDDASYDDTIYSIITIPFVKVDTQYFESDFDTINNYLIYDDDMNIKKVGQNQTLHGEIEITRYYFEIPADTIRYEFYIIDRNKNFSNKEVTSDVGFR